MKIEGEEKLAQGMWVWFIIITEAVFAVTCAGNKVPYYTYLSWMVNEYLHPKQTHNDTSTQWV